MADALTRFKEAVAQRNASDRQLWDAVLKIYQAEPDRFEEFLHLLLKGEIEYRGRGFYMTQRGMAEATNDMRHHELLPWWVEFMENEDELDWDNLVPSR